MIKLDRTLFFISLFLTVICIFVFYCSPFIDPDLWFHIKYGEYMINNKTLIVDHSVFSWTVVDNTWIYNTPLAQIFLYLVDKYTGIIGLHVSHFIFLGIVFLLMMVYPRLLRIKVDIIHFIMGLLVMMSIGLSASQMRPEMFSVLFIFCITFIYFVSINTDRNLFFIYPLIFVLWANSHGVFVFGLFFLIVITISEIIAYFISGDSSLNKKKVFHLLISSSISFVVVFITPYGESWLFAIFKTFLSEEVLRQASMLSGYQSIFAFDHLAKYMLPLMVVTYFGILFFSMNKKISVNFKIIVLNIVFMILSFKYGRTAYYYPPIWFFSMTTMLANIYNSGAIFKPDSLLKQKIVCIVCFILIFLYGIVKPLYYPSKDMYFGIGINESFPSGITQFIKKYKLEGPIYNSFYFGGFLIYELYPMYKVFIDTRHGPYMKGLFDENYEFESGKGFDKFVNKYPFRIAIVQIGREKLIDNFLNSGQWNLIYFDSAGVLFAHRSVNLPNLIVDLNPGNFKHLKSLDSLIRLALVYEKIGDKKSADYIWRLIYNRFGYMF